MFDTIFYGLMGVFGFGMTIAAETSANPDWISYLLQGGPFAIVLLLVVMDKITTPGERDRLRAENEQLREEIRVLNANIREDVVPPLVQINSLMRDVIEELASRPAPVARRRSTTQ